MTRLELLTSFSDADFFTEFERFDRFIDKFRREADGVDFSICSPNYLHDSHIRFACVRVRTPYVKSRSF